MFDPEHLDNCSLLEANEVLKLLGLALVGKQVGPLLVSYNVVSASQGQPVRLRWYLESTFNIYSFSSPGAFMQQLFDEKGIFEFAVWPDGKIFVNEWRGKPHAFAITAVLSGCA